MDFAPSLSTPEGTRCTAAAAAVYAIEVNPANVSGCVPAANSFAFKETVSAERICRLLYCLFQESKLAKILFERRKEGVIPIM